jgi:hypothetical protein
MRFSVLRLRLLGVAAAVAANAIVVGMVLACDDAPGLTTETSTRNNAPSNRDVKSAESAPLGATAAVVDNGVTDPAGIPASDTPTSVIISLVDWMSLPVSATTSLASRSLTGVTADPSSAKSTGTMVAKPPLRFGTIGNDVLSITTAAGDAGALQIVGVGPSVNMKLGVRWAAPAVSAGKTLTLLPWARATYRYDVLADAPKLPTLLADGLDLGGGLNLFSGTSVAASLSADWERREGAGAISGLGRLRIGF